MSAPPDRHALRAAIEDVLYAGVLHLDAAQFSEWLELTTPEFQYRIVAFSPEIRRDMTWLEHDQNGLRGLFALLPKHHVDHAPWLRHAVLYRLELADTDQLNTVTSLAVYRTAEDTGDSHITGGSSQLFVVGRYHDRFKRIGERWLLDDRTVRLETRQLGLGSHMIV